MMICDLASAAGQVVKWRNLLLDFWYPHIFHNSNMVSIVGLFLPQAFCWLVMPFWLASTLSWIVFIAGFFKFWLPFWWSTLSFFVFFFGTFIPGFFKHLWSFWLSRHLSQVSVMTFRSLSQTKDMSLQQVFAKIGYFPWNIAIIIYRMHYRIDIETLHSQKWTQHIQGAGILMLLPSKSAHTSLWCCCAGPWLWDQSEWTRS